MQAFLVTLCEDREIAPVIFAVIRIGDYQAERMYVRVIRLPG